MARFETVVSLGYFCSAALENQRIGLRSVSLPFDWLIVSSFGRVLRLMQTGFDHFLREEDMYQEYSINPRYYYDAYNHIHFYHDFTDKTPLADQLPAVRVKYQRRISRFYDTICRPTLFIRYCSDVKEMEYINSNYEAILHFLKTYHDDNHIVFVYHCPFAWQDGIDAYFVKRDSGDSVARTYLRKNRQLRAYILENVRMEDRSGSRRRYWTGTVSRGVRKITYKFKCMFPRDVYVHHRQLEDLEKNKSSETDHRNGICLIPSGIIFSHSGGSSGESK